MRKCFTHEEVPHWSKQNIEFAGLFTCWNSKKAKLKRIFLIRVSKTLNLQVRLPAGTWEKIDKMLCLWGCSPVKASKMLNLQVRLPAETREKIRKMLYLWGIFFVKASKMSNLQVRLLAETQRKKDKML